MNCPRLKLDQLLGSLIQKILTSIIAVSYTHLDVYKRQVKERMLQIEKTLPEGVAVEAYLDRTKMVNNAISTVRTNLLEGALIVLFILVLLLGNWRAGLIVASVIPLALLFAVIMMHAFGVSGNLMSLGAIDFGLIVDLSLIHIFCYCKCPAAEKFKIVKLFFIN